MSFIDGQKIQEIIDNTNTVSDSEFERIISKAKDFKGLSLWEVGVLLNLSDSSKIEKVLSTAKIVKRAIYGSRLVLFAPLYVSNFCSNNCLYCGFRKDNLALDRGVLSETSLVQEVKQILVQGHKRVLMLMGEDFSKFSFDKFMEYLKIVYSVTDDKGSSVRRINVEIPSLDEAQFSRLAKCEIGTYTVFQETYHKETYNQVHPSGEKADYSWRLNVMDRALKNGMNDVGIGVLFGLYDFKFEVLSLLMHAEHLDSTYGVGPHTISVPRIEPVANVPYTKNPPYAVSDEDFKKIVAILRLAVPYTGLILSTRESVALRNELFSLGVSQISAGSHTEVGGYSDSNPKMGQFTLNDFRNCDQVMSEVVKQGNLPSFCTACYRKGRVGKDFMDLAKPGLIQDFCQPNAILTFQEYLTDYGENDLVKVGEDLINESLSDISTEKRREETLERINRIKNGERDIYF
ncbi:[FeFe] hydrogenase H-cluster radical SAM maturase HydG [Candidatus Woesearchaeota archaeon]|jgi:2-iminoacetate synthase|nr:[FeFe] hydrogenase H-cluster radical SAM maturase HydG [Candidatus Woesearchaeota archaeon]MBT3537214.1 [FeFe] hydrogenase H-cluster radical SAM maturase HydG [Candidatus Woesearchaeota archaeon]MBT4698201.1 [FeFe] hydrogenase H-cluster radical SAM maturase HydG [Candidatus Woesearchaeota archaeon]MBT4717754.1 [FeFe] hydrogenase H-cluster radical SAM maturase HydG [Candidatus Woesearchaeota archaeon]MBT7106476.1 [FeFe] hydrogenase H-cluster radical SAM maturase HydG [Candidatus Woesearchaeot